MLQKQKVEKNAKPTLGEIKKFFKKLTLAIEEGKIPSPISEKDFKIDIGEIIREIYKEKQWPLLVPLKKLYCSPDNTRVSEYVLNKYRALQKQVADLGITL